MNRNRPCGINAPALIYSLVACLLVFSGCADRKNSRKDKAKPDAEVVEVDPYQLGYDTGDRFVTECLQGWSTGAQAFSERLKADNEKDPDGKHPEKRDMPTGEGRGKAWKAIADAARSAAAANVNTTAAPYLNLKMGEAPDFYRGYADGLKHRVE